MHSAWSCGSFGNLHLAKREISRHHLSNTRVISNVSHEYSRFSTNSLFPEQRLIQESNAFEIILSMVQLLDNLLDLLIAHSFEAFSEESFNVL